MDHPVLMRMDVPPAVDNAIQSLVQACHQWHPVWTATSDKGPVMPPALPDQISVCRFVISPAPWHGLLPDFWAIVVLTFLVLCVFWAIRLHRLPFVLIGGVSWLFRQLHRGISAHG